MPFFSIIIPSYNAENSITACLNSIFEQSFTDYEIWVIDGYSTDTTVEILHHYQTRHHQLHFLSEKDKGIYDALNKGIQLAKSDWILCLGSDDTLYDTAVLSKIFRWLVLNPGEKMIYGDVQIIGDNHWAKDGERYAGAFSIHKLLHQNICQQSIFYHKNIFKEFGLFNEQYLICADWDFNMKCFAFCQPRYVELIITRFTTGGLSSTFLQKDNFLAYDFVDNYAKYFRLSIYNILFKHHFQVLLNQSIRLFHQKHFVKSLNHFFAAIYLSGKVIYCIKVYLIKTLSK